MKHAWQQFVLLAREWLALRLILWLVTVLPETPESDELLDAFATYCGKHGNRLKGEIANQ